MQKVTPIRSQMNSKQMLDSKVAEEHVIGKALIDRDAAKTAIGIVKSQDFHEPQLGLIFAAIAALLPFDMAGPDAVMDLLNRTGMLAEAGGQEAISLLATETATGANVRLYAERVAKCARERQLIRIDTPSYDTHPDVPMFDHANETQTNGKANGHAEKPAEPAIQLLGFSTEEILAPIPPEKFVLPGIPAEAFTLIAGALSSYKTTLLLYLLVWKATGWDLLDLDPGGYGVDVGKSALLTYEDTDRRILAKLQRVIQHGHHQILTRHGRRDAERFVEHTALNIRRVPLSGHADMGLIRRLDNGNFHSNDWFINQLSTQLRQFAPEGALIGLDPLRLAVAGSQNDDEAAAVAVHTLNRVAAEIDNSGLVVLSHTTKSQAKDKDEGGGYTEGAYATAGSALYSQHARSNFLMTRLTANDIRKDFDRSTVTPEEAGKQMVARLTHGRLSHGHESGERYLLMRAGCLVPVKKLGAQTPAEQIYALLVPFVAAMDRINTSNLKVTTAALEKDLKGQFSQKDVRAAKQLLEENGFIEGTGSTTARNLIVTAKARQLLADESQRKSPAGVREWPK